jgi:rRNA small subunit pseudouridine methyltransferase Nep1
MVPQQPRIPKTAQEKEQSRRLYIVLSQACLETYQLSSSGPSGAARRDGRGYEQKEERYTLLNCDDHVCWAHLLRTYASHSAHTIFGHLQQGILSKMNREVATARPDITHQVR